MCECARQPHPLVTTGGAVSGEAIAGRYFERVAGVVLVVECPTPFLEDHCELLPINIVTGVRGLKSDSI